MITGWLTASAQPDTGGTNDGIGSAAMPRAVCCTSPEGIPSGWKPSSRTRSTPVTIPGPAMLYAPGGPAPSTQRTMACPTSSSWMNCIGTSGAGRGTCTGRPRAAAEIC